MIRECLSVKKTNKKSKALKNEGNCFFKAFLMSVAVSFLCIILLSMAVSAFMVSKDDSTENIKMISSVIMAVSLAIGGFVCAKIEKRQGIVTAFLCGLACLGLCYVLSTVLELGGQMDVINKSVTIGIMLLSPVLGAKMSSKRHTNTRRTGRNTTKL